MLQRDRVRSGQHSVSTQATRDQLPAAIRSALSEPKRPSIPIRHTRPAGFRSGEALPIEASFERGDGPEQQAAVNSPLKNGIRPTSTVIILSLLFRNTD